jgi:modulator of FtsH protease HflC
LAADSPLFGVLLDSNYFNGGAPGSDGIRRELPRK